jgi:glucose-1-phosphate cytidylyltransferase
MIEIGGKPILWHIMKIYNFYGIKEFIICLGCKGYIIKEYFFNYTLINSDITLQTNNDGCSNLIWHRNNSEDWKITLIDTGEDTMTGGRIKKVGYYLYPDLPFCMTYGDGVANINITDLIQFHLRHRRLATITGVTPLARFGALHLEGDLVTQFREKPENEAGFINGGFFVLQPDVLRYIDDDTTSWEKEPLERLANEKQLCAFLHNDFWYPMDTLRDRQYLESLWANGKASWKVW